MECGASQRTSALLPRLVAWHPLVACAFTVACARAPERSALPAAPRRCTLEIAIGDAVSSGAGGSNEEPVRRCNESGGECGDACAAATRACALEAARGRRPFVALWTGNYLDGVGHRFAVTGRGSGESYRVEWLAYTLASGSDRGARGGVGYESIAARECESLVDFREECAPSGPRRLCDVSMSDREAALDLGCVARGERLLCQEALPGAM